MTPESEQLQRLAAIDAEIAKIKGLLPPKVRRNLTAYSPHSLLIAPRHMPLVTTVSYVQLWRMRQKGMFPEPIRLSKGRIAWRRSDIEEWMATREHGGAHRNEK